MKLSEETVLLIGKKLLTNRTPAPPVRSCYVSPGVRVTLVKAGRFIDLDLAINCALERLQSIYYDCRVTDIKLGPKVEGDYTAVIVFEQGGLR